jgi:hypothetical protein
MKVPDPRIDLGQERHKIPTGVEHSTVSAAEPALSLPNE